MSTPLFQDFNPNLVPWQIEAIKKIYSFDYEKLGILEVLFSGSVGSAKSILGAHLIVRQALENNGAKIIVLRRALKDLKRTLWELILKHSADIPQFIKNYNKSEMKITFINDSEILGDSYDEGNFEKFRSLELSMAVIEEASESTKELYDALKMRLGRQLKIKKNILLLITNPDDPSHYIYEEFIQKKSENKMTFFSKTSENKFIPSWYVNNLKETLDQKMAKRMLEGQWVRITEDSIYYAYDPDVSFKKQDYQIQNYQINLAFDFNIGIGKPMSCAISQFDGNAYHFFDAVTVHGARTEQVMEEIAAKGYFDLGLHVNIYGDATGRARSTKSLHTDYDVILNFLKNYKRPISFSLKVPMENPPIRERHNTVNAFCKNANGVTRLYVYPKAKIIDEGLRLTAFKKGGFLVEDDSKEYQHITTAIGYQIVYDSRLRSLETFKVSSGGR